MKNHKRLVEAIAVDSLDMIAALKLEGAKLEIPPIVIKFLNSHTLERGWQ